MSSLSPDQLQQFVSGNSNIQNQLKNKSASIGSLDDILRQTGNTSTGYHVDPASGKVVGDVSDNNPQAAQSNFNQNFQAIQNYKQQHGGDWEGAYYETTGHKMPGGFGVQISPNGATVNKDTPAWKKIANVAIPVGAMIAAPFTGGLSALALGAGAGAATGGINGGWKGALIGGALGGATAGIGQAIPGKSLLSNVERGAATGAVKGGASGGVGGALEGGLMGGATGGANAEIGKALPGNDLFGQLARRAVTNTADSALHGQMPMPSASWAVSPIAQALLRNAQSQRGPQ